MVPWAWDPKVWVEQMMYFGWLLMVIAGIAVALSIIFGAVLAMLEWIKDEATSTLNPNEAPLAHVLNFRQRKSADV